MHEEDRLEIKLSHEAAWIGTDTFFEHQYIPLDVETQENVLDKPLAVIITQSLLTQCSFDKTVQMFLFFSQWWQGIDAQVRDTSECQFGRYKSVFDGPDQRLKELELSCFYADEENQYVSNVLQSMSHQLLFVVDIYNMLNSTAIHIKARTAEKNLVDLSKYKDSSYSMSFSSNNSSSHYTSVEFYSNIPLLNTLHFYIHVREWKGYYDERCTYGGIWYRWV